MFLGTLDNSEDEDLDLSQQVECYHLFQYQAWKLGRCSTAHGPIASKT